MATIESPVFAITKWTRKDSIGTCEITRNCKAPRGQEVVVFVIGLHKEGDPPVDVPAWFDKVARANGYTKGSDDAKA